MKGKILLVGGRGTVGKYIYNNLNQRYPNRVLVCGRSSSLKIDSTSSINSNNYIQLDICKLHGNEDKLKEVVAVISCISPVNLPFVRFCIKNSINYIDISPAYENIDNIKKYFADFPDSKSNIVLGVGLAPGISNLMVKEGIKPFNYVKSVEISLLLGLGEQHGDNGIKWFLESLNKPINNNGKNVKVFTKKKKIAFPDPLGLKPTYNFNNADRYIVSRTLDIPEVYSRYAYDSSLITYFISFLQFLGVFKLMKIPGIKRFMIFIFRNILRLIKKIGVSSDVYSIAINISGEIDGKEENRSTEIIGWNNSKLTADTSVIVLNSILESDISPGAYYIEELFSYDLFKENLKEL